VERYSNTLPIDISFFDTTTMDIEKTIRDLQPLCGKVTPIRTIQETRPPEDFGMVGM
jgi:hypothetical protein